MHMPAYSMASPASSSPTVSRPLPVNGNSFFVRLIFGNIRICQGCRGSLRELNGSIPLPPMDIAVARLEQRPYFDKASGSFCTPKKETHSHYHPRVACISIVEPNFFPKSLVVLLEVKEKLLQVHKNYIRTEFGLTI